MMITITASHPLVFLAAVVVLITLIAALVAGRSGGRGRQAAARRRLEEEVRTSQQRIAQIGERTRAAIIAEARRRQADGQSRRS